MVKPNVVLLLVVIFVSAVVSFQVDDRTAAEQLAQAPEVPVTKLIFVKTHKTASSTVTGILHHYAHNHNLTAYIPWHRYTPQTVQLDPVWGPFYETCDIFANHIAVGTLDNAIQWLNKVVPGGVWLTVLRDPVSRAVSFSNFFSKFPMKSHLNLHYPYGGEGKTIPEGAFFRDSQISFGINTEQDLHRLFYMMEHEFGAILINELLDECLVWMKRRFGWELDDIIYMSMKVEAGEKSLHGIKRERPSDLTEEQRQQIRELSGWDVDIYNFARGLAEQRIAEMPPDFKDEVKLFREKRARVQKECERAAAADRTEYCVELMKDYPQWTYSEAQRRKVPMAPHPQRLRPTEALIDAIHHTVERVSEPEGDGAASVEVDDLETVAGIDREAEAILAQDLDEMESFFEMGF